MVISPSHPNKSPLSSLHIFLSMNKTSHTTTSSSSSSSSITTMKLKTIINNLIFSHICRVIRALSRAKTVLLEVFRENQIMYLKQSKRKNKYRKKILFGSFRLHYNWCSSSHVLPIPSPMFDGITNNIYYDSTWNSMYNDGVSKEQDNELFTYLQWLEEKGANKENINININNNNNNNNNNNSNNNNCSKNSNNKNGNGENEIDKLADMFIADCHEKFRLEKIESYRRYQELLARSI